MKTTIILLFLGGFLVRARIEDILNATISTQTSFILGLILIGIALMRLKKL
tara:strand:+ start:677 stop:829 length:153 start_codon:yes stop_codon:yes gene_type:complete